MGVDVSRFPEVTPLGTGYIHDLVAIHIKIREDLDRAQK